MKLTGNSIIIIMLQVLVSWTVSSCNLPVRVPVVLQQRMWNNVHVPMAMLDSSVSPVLLDTDVIHRLAVRSLAASRATVTSIQTHATSLPVSHLMNIYLLLN